MKTIIPVSLKNLGVILLICISFLGCQTEEQESILKITTDNIQYMEGLNYRFTGNLSGVDKGEITDHGFCWSESEYPDISGSSYSLGTFTSTGEFSCTLNEFSATTSYYVRAYALVNSKPVYGNQLSFTTTWNPDNTVKDVDGNLYSSVQIGEQTWMAQDLKATRYADGVAIENVKDSYTWFNFSEANKAYCHYDNDLINGYTYGVLYTWAAAARGGEGSDLVPSGIQGVCPDGWHLPSDNEWKQLEIYLGMSPEEADKEDWRGVGLGNKLRQEGSVYWISPNSGANNETGFDALPGGYRHGSAEFLGLGSTARYWTSTRFTYGWFRGLDYDNSAINRSSSGLYRGYSVRCVKD